MRVHEMISHTYERSSSRDKSLSQESRKMSQDRLICVSMLQLRYMDNVVWHAIE